MQQITRPLPPWPTFEHCDSPSLGPCRGHVETTLWRAFDQSKCGALRIVAERDPRAVGTREHLMHGTAGPSCVGNGALDGVGAEEEEPVRVYTWTAGNVGHGTNTRRRVGAVRELVVRTVRPGRHRLRNVPAEQRAVVRAGGGSIIGVQDAVGDLEHRSSVGLRWRRERHDGAAGITQYRELAAIIGREGRPQLDRTTCDESTGHVGTASRIAEVDVAQPVWYGAARARLFGEQPDSRTVMPEQLGVEGPGGGYVGGAQFEAAEWCDDVVTLDSFSRNTRRRGLPRHGPHRRCQRRICPGQQFRDRPPHPLRWHDPHPHKLSAIRIAIPLAADARKPTARQAQRDRIAGRATCRFTNQCPPLCHIECHRKVLGRRKGLIADEQRDGAVEPEAVGWNGIQGAAIRGLRAGPRAKGRTVLRRRPRGHRRRTCNQV